MLKTPRGKQVIALFGGKKVLFFSRLSISILSAAYSALAIRRVPLKTLCSQFLSHFYNFRRGKRRNMLDLQRKRGHSGPQS